MLVDMNSPNITPISPFLWSGGWLVLLTPDGKPGVVSERVSKVPQQAGQMGTWGGQQEETKGERGFSPWFNVVLVPRYRS